MSDTPEEKALKGLGGWLALLGVQLVITPVRLLVYLAPLYSTFLTEGTWEALTSPGQPAYHPLWGPFIIGEIAFNLVFLVASCWLIFLFFKQRRTFPKAYIWVAVANFAFIVADALFIKLIDPTIESFDTDTLKEVARSGVALLIWTPYLMLSKRVNATFIE